MSDTPSLCVGVFEIWIQLCISVIQILCSFSLLIRLQRHMQLNWSHSVLVCLQIKTLRTALYLKFRYEVISVLKEVGKGRFLRTKRKLKNSDETAARPLLLHLHAVRFR